MAAADEVAVEIAEILEVFKHDRFRSRRAEFRMGFMAVEAFQIDRFSVQQNLFLSGFDGAYAEAFHDAVAGRMHFHGVKFRFFESPQTEIRDRAFDRFAMTDFNGAETGFRIKTESDALFAFRAAGKEELERNFACFDAERADLYAVDCRFKDLMQGNAAIEAAECIEVIVWEKQFHFIAGTVLGADLVEIVVDRGGDDVASGFERSGFKFHTAVRQIGEADFAPVDAESCAETDRTDF